MKKMIISLSLTFSLILTGCSSSNDSATNSDSKSESALPREAIIKNGKTVCDEPALDENKEYSVEFDTTMGSFTVDLDVKNAPVSTAHLAALVKSGFYDGLTFHRAVPGFVIQGGDPNGDGSGSSECSVISEEPQREYKQGDFAWAKGENDPAGKAGSQFFIVTGESNSQSVSFLSQKSQGAVDEFPKIQYGFAGTVSKGLDVALAIEGLSPGGDGPPKEIVTISSAKLKS